MFINDSLAAKFGIRYLFLEPEYQGVVGFLSFFFLGIGFGGMVMTWNLTTYLLNARYFPFLATLESPFGKYSFNNALLPIGFFGFYVYRLREFLISELAYGSGQLLQTVVAILLGTLLVVVSYILYFRFTNKDIASYPHLQNLISSRQRRRTPMPPGYRKMDIERIISGETAWRVETYLTERFQTRRTRSIAHYRPEQLLRIFKQNHLNALILQTALLVALMATGLGIDYSWVRIPAGASIYILFSVIVAVTGAITYWFHSWRTTIFVLLLVAINTITGQDWFSFRNRAYGMDYRGDLPIYSYNRLEELASPDKVYEDRDSMQLILERWKARTGKQKPKMVLLCVSGGGLKATYWTTAVIQQAYRLTGGEILKHTSMISGASGGMIGAAYFRELALRYTLYNSKQGANLPGADGIVLESKLKSTSTTSRSSIGASDEAIQDSLPMGFGEIGVGTASVPYVPLGFRQNLPVNSNPTNPMYLEATGRDLLNSLGFAIVSKDLFFPAGKFEYEGDRFRKDRAYAFERQLSENLGGVLDKSLGDYEAPERAAEIPMLFLTPSVVNDARRLIISPLGVRHLTLPPAGVGRNSEFEVDAVDFGAFFANCRPHQLSFPTALRMNATYPYVLPNVYLPSNPPVEVMDAGFRDNFGVLEASRFLQVYRNWIIENTSGVALIQISTQQKFDRAEAKDPEGWIESLFNPLGVAGQIISLQDFQTDETVGLLYDLLGADYFDFIRFSYSPTEDRRAASMTFHLTEGERNDIRESINHPNNLIAMARVQAALRE